MCQLTVKAKKQNPRTMIIKQLTLMHAFLWNMHTHTIKKPTKENNYVYNLSLSDNYSIKIQVLKNLLLN